MKKIDKNFYKHLNFVLTSALDYIENSIKSGQVIKFWKFDEDPEGDEDEFYYLPTVTYVTKHGFYEQYAVMSVSKKDNDIVLSVMGRGQDQSVTEFKLSEISNDDAVSIVLLADIIQNKKD